MGYGCIDPSLQVKTYGVFRHTSLQLRCARRVPGSPQNSRDWRKSDARHLQSDNSLVKEIGDGKGTTSHASDPDL